MPNRAPRAIGVQTKSAQYRFSEAAKEYDREIRFVGVPLVLRTGVRISLHDHCTLILKKFHIEGGSDGF